ncbi:MAG: hypothetical protein PUJ59_02140 [Clostridiaceae bacterium]|nr:hypothetical protein [Clostridiaceae bacterium]MDY5889957.1 hypothetical protein [Oscillospiraceae bacterium]
MGLKNLDKSAEQKGSGIVTLWQFVKFIFVSLLACIVQFGVLNLLMLLPQIKEIMNDDFTWFVFNYVGEGKGFGYFIAFNIANILAQIVAFFVNREKTFGSSSNIAVTLPIYIVFTVALICFSAWLAPTIQGWLISLNLSAQLAANISTMACSAIQFFIYFPVDKILFHKKKEEKKEK